MFEPWNWMISTGNYIDEMEADMKNVKSTIKNTEIRLEVAMVVAGIIIAVGIWRRNLRTAYKNPKTCGPYGSGRFVVECGYSQ